MTTPTPPVRYLTATHSMSTAGGMRLTMHPDSDAAETVLELGALGYLYECHLLVDSATPSGSDDLRRYPSPADRIFALEAEAARLRRQTAHLTEEVHDLLARLQEAHNDADRLAVAVLVASGDMDAAEALGPHPTAEQVDVAVNNAAARILNEWGPWRPVAGGAR